MNDITRDLTRVININIFLVHALFFCITQNSALHNNISEIQKYMIVYCQLYIYQNILIYYLHFAATDHNAFNIEWYICGVRQASKNICFFFCFIFLFIWRMRDINIKIESCIVNKFVSVMQNMYKFES